ncbi:hypothetical protein TNCV_3579551 [Trichonephila clavipes]|nr:hypothetical protein TNCV_3579551 [Trichonephila clavipes]
MEAGCSAQPVARQVSRSDLTVRRCLDQWTEDTSFTWLQTQAAYSLRASVSSQNIARCLAEGHLRLRRERLKLTFAFQQHTVLTAGSMVWDVIAYDAR